MRGHTAFLVSARKLAPGTVTPAAVPAQAAIARANRSVVSRPTSGSSWSAVRLVSCQASRIGANSMGR